MGGWGGRQEGREGARVVSMRTCYLWTYVVDTWKLVDGNHDHCGEDWGQSGEMAVTMQGYSLGHQHYLLG